MGLQATSPPTSPLHRPLPVAASMNTMNTNPSMLKRKHDLVEDDEDVLMSVTAGSGVKKICVEVVGCGVNVNGNEVSHESVQLGHHRHHGNNSDEDLEDFSDDEANTSSDDDRSSNGLEDSIMMTSSNESNCEENKENTLNVNKLSKGELDSILAKTLLNTATLSAPTPPNIADNATSGVHPPGLTPSVTPMTNTTSVVVATDTMPKNDN